MKKVIFILLLVFLFWKIGLAYAGDVSKKSHGVYKIVNGREESCKGGKQSTHAEKAMRGLNMLKKIDPTRYERQKAEFSYQQKTLAIVEKCYKGFLDIPGAEAQLYPLIKERIIKELGEAHLDKKNLEKLIKEHTASFLGMARLKQANQKKRIPKN